jgi:hypothetical protein
VVLGAALVRGRVRPAARGGGRRRRLRRPPPAAAAARRAPPRADFDFTPYAPRRLPAGFRTNVVRADGGLRPALIHVYDMQGAAFAIGIQQRASLVSLAPGHCSLARLAATGTDSYEGACREARSPGGRRVYVGASRAVVGGREAFAVLGGTLVRLETSGVGERAVLAWFDGLRPVPPSEIDFKGP